MSSSQYLNKKKKKKKKNKILLFQVKEKETLSKAFVAAIERATFTTILQYKDDGLTRGRNIE